MFRTPNVATVIVDEKASWRRFQECMPRVRIVTDASIENLRRDGMAKRDYELNAIKRSKGERMRDDGIY